MWINLEGAWGRVDSWTYYMVYSLFCWPNNPITKVTCILYSIKQVWHSLLFWGHKHILVALTVFILFGMFQQNDLVLCILVGINAFIIKELVIMIADNIVKDIEQNEHKHWIKAPSEIEHRSAHVILQLDNCWNFEKQGKWIIGSISNFTSLLKPGFIPVNMFCRKCMFPEKSHMLFLYEMWRNIYLFTFEAGICTLLWSW